jgi:hypothetical protein
MTGTIVLADNLTPQAVTLSAQNGGQLSVGPRCTISEPTAEQFGLLSNSGNGQTLIDVTTVAGTVWSAGPVDLRNDVQINGDVHGGSTVALGVNTKVTGTVTQNTPVGSTTVTVTVTFPTTTDDRHIDDGKDLDLPPGSYRDVTTNNGGLILRSGTYFFNTLTLNSGTRFQLDTTNGPIFVYTMTSFIFRPIQSSLGGSVSAFRVFSFGTADVPIEAAFTGTVAAPLATIRLQANAPHAGAFFGMGIFAQAGTIIRHVGFPAWGTKPPPAGQIPRRIPTPSVPPRGCGQPPPNVGPFPPPASGSSNPWDIFQIMLKACRGDSAPTPRKDAYLPYLVVRANPSDRGGRPLPDGTVFWESPDIFVMPNQPVNGAPQVPANLGGMAQAGVPNTIFAHVWNLGNAPAFDVIVEFYWFNPTLGIELSDANYIGRSVVSLGPKSSTKSHAIVRCPVDWVPVFENNGHECLVVRAFSFLSDPMPDDMFSATDSRHVAQRNIAVLQGAQAQASNLTLNVAPGHSTHDAQIQTVEIAPDQLQWMKLITMSRNPNLQPPTATPLVGVTPPMPPATAGGMNLGGLSSDALQNVIAKQQGFPRATDPLQVTLVARAGLQAGQAHVVRVQQTHETTLVGGYTTILLP